jgi:predicted metal-dependent peptidase
MKKNPNLNSLEKGVIEYVAGQLEIDRYKLQKDFPFIGNVLMRLPCEVVENGMPPTAATDGHTIMANPMFIAGLTEEERRFVLAHEVMHCVMLHRLREKGRDHQLWNVATDLEIHFILTDEGLTAPFVLPHDEDWNGLSAEEIYEKLLEKIDQNKDNAKGKGKGSGSGSGNDSDGQNSPSSSGGSSSKNGKTAKVKAKMDNQGSESKNIKSEGTIAGTDLPSSFDDIFDKQKMEEAGGTEEETELTDEQIRDDIIEKVRAASKTAGHTPGQVSNLIDSVTKREVPWRELLAQYVTSAHKDSCSWFPPSRRHVWRDMYLPSRHTESLRCVVALDTSGSTSPFLSKFFTELESLLGTFGKYEVTVIQCDYAVQRVDTYNSDTGIPKDGWEASGYGGTSFVPVFDYVNDNIGDLNPSCLIYLTDGYGDAPQNPPPYPVMWVISPGGRNSCPYGTVINMKNQEND